MGGGGDLRRGRRGRRGARAAASRRPTAPATRSSCGSCASTAPTTTATTTCSRTRCCGSSSTASGTGRYAPEMSAATRAAWESYRRVNEAFAAAVADECGGADAVLVHDYQLYLVPRMLRDGGRPRAAVALHAHPVARPRRLARADRRHAHRPARGPARRRRDRLPHQPLGARVPRDRRGVRGRGVRRPRAAAGDAARGRHPRARVPDLGRPGRVPGAGGARTPSPRPRRGWWPPGRSSWSCASTAPTRRRTSCAASTRSPGSSPATPSGTAGCGCSRYWTRPGRRSPTMRSTLERSTVRRAR